MCVKYKAKNNLVMNLCYIRKIYIVDRGVLHVAQCNTCMPSSERLWLPYTYIVGLHKKIRSCKVLIKSSYTPILYLNEYFIHITKGA